MCYASLYLRAFSHFLVDALCVSTLYALSPLVPVQSLVGIFLTYNCLAFLSQPLTGMCADNNRMRQLLPPIFMITFAVALFLPVFYIKSVSATNTLVVYVVAMLLAIGNSFFHVWGGKITAVSTHNDSRALGIFTSMGAFGLSIGMVAASWKVSVGFFVLLCLSILLSLRTDYSKNSYTEAISVAETLSRPFVLIVLALVGLMLFVTLRALAASWFTTAIANTDTSIVLLIGFLAMAGKFVSGFIAKCIGLWNALFLALALLSVSYFAINLHSSIAYLGVLVSGLTMAITLRMANDLLPKREGLAFGLLAAALIPGSYL